MNSSISFTIPYHTHYLFNRNCLILIGNYLYLISYLYLIIYLYLVITISLIDLTI